jgi:protein TonB
VEKRGIGSLVLQRVAAFVLAALMTLAVFLVLPLMQTIAAMSDADSLVRSVSTVHTPPPPPPPAEEQPEPEKQEEPPPPELTEEAPPLDLAQLELALNPSLGDAAFGEISIELSQQLANEGGEAIDRVFSLQDLDQRPRPIFQRSPTYPSELYRARREATVYVVFQVDPQGRVLEPTVQKSTDPAFEAAALEAVKQWRFEPGTRNGKAVSFKMRQPITFRPPG